MIWLLLYIIPCLLLAWYNAKLIKKGKKILHFWNGLMHFSTAVAATIWLKDWRVPVIIWLLAKTVFDTALNLMRGLPLDYISPEVKKYAGLKEALKKGKTTDWLEYKIFHGNAVVAKIVYLFIIVMLFVI